MRLEGRVAIVTGASSGIGNGIAKRFAMEGAKLSVTEYRTPLTELLSFVRGLGREILSTKVDMHSTPQVNELVKRTLETYGRIDILASVAGSVSWGRVEDITDEEWDYVVGGDLMGTFRLTRAVVPAMKKRHYGRVILTSSIEGKAVGWPGRVHYCAGKGGIDAMTRGLALELAKEGITVNAIAPGPIESNMIKSRASLGEEATHNLVRYIPVGYMGQPEDVAALAVYLASEEARYMTGQSMVIDGGYIIAPGAELPGANPPPPEGMVFRREEDGPDKKTRS